MNNSPIELINLNLYNMTKKERAIAEYILEDPHKAIQFSAEMIAEQTHTSKAAFIRFCQKLGFNGYAEFKFALSRSLVAYVNYVDDNNPIKQITQSYSNFIMQINSMVTQEEVTKISKLILSARKLKIFGVNRTALSAHQFRMRLGKIGLDAEFCDDTVTMRDIIEYLGPEDLCIIFSIKVMGATYGDIIPELANNGVKTVLLTMTPNNKFANDVTHMVSLPYISKSSSKAFLDDQAIFFVLNEILLNEIARVINNA
jgi:DNA-binding MurR/RpiR family transcriptional regulator